jgi:hypothetical protein
LSRVRQHRTCRIAKQRDAIQAPVADGIAIDAFVQSQIVRRCVLRDRAEAVVETRQVSTVAR